MSVEVLIVVMGTEEAQFSEPALLELPALPDIGDWIHVPRTHQLPVVGLQRPPLKGARLEVRHRHFGLDRAWVQLDCVVLADDAPNRPLLVSDLSAVDADPSIAMDNP
jgi:hypothetical protein